MKKIFLERTTRGMLSFHNGDASLRGNGILQRDKETVNTIVYNLKEAQQVTIDNIPYTLPPDTALPLMTNQHFVFENPQDLIAWQFNREFYCIADHDQEVGCVGFLFYGMQDPFFIPLNAQDRQSLAILESQCLEEMSINDKMQAEMLRTILKRLIIKITRLAKSQTIQPPDNGTEKLDLIRKFNLLLEIHFRTRHEVQFYARALHKSPKTLTNLFCLYNYPAPSKLIQQRLILEAKRYLYYTGRSAKEVAAELGFASPAHFSRFFKAGAGINFSEWSATTPQLQNAS